MGSLKNSTFAGMNGRSTIRHDILTSLFTFPVVLLLSWALWVLPSVSSWRVWLGWASCGVVSGLWLLVNQQLSVLRHGGVMLFVMGMSWGVVCPQYHAYSQSWLLCMLFLLSQWLLFKSYQQQEAQNVLFQSFALLGLGSLLFPPLLFLSAYYMIVMLIYLRNFNLRNLLAGVLGLALPYWFYAGWKIWVNDAAAVVDLFDSSFRLSSSGVSYSGVEQAELILLGAMGLMSLLHYYRTNYKDKIRVRMYYYVLIVQELLLFGAVLFWRSDEGVWLLLLLCNSVPLSAHYLALSQRNRWTNWMLLFWLFCFIGCGLYGHLYA